MYPGFKQCVGVEYLKRYLDLLQHWRTRTFDTFLYEISLVNLPMTLAFL